MTEEEASRYHAAAKIIEADGREGYFSCLMKHGPEIAGAVLVTWLRGQMNPDDNWPASDDLVDRVNETIRRAGRMEVSQQRIGDTMTAVVGSAEKVRVFARALLAAANAAEEKDEVQHVEEIFEQSRHRGPWGLLIHVTKG